MNIRRLFIGGYRDYELGIFKKDDPKIEVIKAAIAGRLIQYIEEGLEWVMVSGNLGIDMWVGEVVEELQVTYPLLKLAVLLPFENSEANWNETNRLQFQQLKDRAEFVDSISHQPYESPMQFINHTYFMLHHTEACLLVYDEEKPGKTQYFLKAAYEFQNENTYAIELLTFDDLQNTWLE